ncbi:rad17 cell cycle checkpoint protein [Cystoisospora suis]|uniref:Rad17 cell cycle checkpoint protein n=1 Tax=Cystoisospora suis TaxID=483139 RepID=A0A2C6KJE7_9APIC|nr:rad17 cell cycle checkpoint protein [Cystoisospora suis]
MPREPCHFSSFSDDVEESIEDAENLPLQETNHRFLSQTPPLSPSSDSSCTVLSSPFSISRSERTSSRIISSGSPTVHRGSGREENPHCVFSSSPSRMSGGQVPRAGETILDLTQLSSSSSSEGEPCTPPVSSRAMSAGLKNVTNPSSQKEERFSGESSTVLKDSSLPARKADKRSLLPHITRQQVLHSSSTPPPSSPSQSVHAGDVSEREISRNELCTAPSSLLRGQTFLRNPRSSSSKAEKSASSSLERDKRNGSTSFPLEKKEVSETKERTRCVRETSFVSTPTLHKQGDLFLQDSSVEEDISKTRRSISTRVNDGEDERQRRGGHRDGDAHSHRDLPSAVHTPEKNRLHKGSSLVEDRRNEHETQDTEEEERDNRMVIANSSLHSSQRRSSRTQSRGEAALSSKDERGGRKKSRRNKAAGKAGLKELRSGKTVDYSTQHLSAEEDLSTKSDASSGDRAFHKTVKGRKRRRGKEDEEDEEEAKARSFSHHNYSKDESSDSDEWQSWESKYTPKRLQDLLHAPQKIKEMTAFLKPFSGGSLFNSFFLHDDEEKDSGVSFNRPSNHLLRHTPSSSSSVPSGSTSRIPLISLRDGEHSLDTSRTPHSSSSSSLPLPPPPPLICILHGPSGCGKKTLVKTVAMSLGMQIIEWGEEAIPSIGGEGLKSSRRSVGIGGDFSDDYDTGRFFNLSLGNSLLSFLDQTQSRTPLPMLILGDETRHRRRRRSAYAVLASQSRMSSRVAYEDSEKENDRKNERSVRTIDHLSSSLMKKKKRRGRDASGQEREEHIDKRREKDLETLHEETPLIQDSHEVYRRPIQGQPQPQQVALLRELPTNLLLNHSPTFIRNARDYLHKKISEHCRSFYNLVNSKTRRRGKELDPEKESTGVFTQQANHDGGDTPQTRGHDDNTVGKETGSDFSSSFSSSHAKNINSLQADRSSQRERCSQNRGEDISWRETRKDSWGESSMSGSVFPGVQPVVVCVSDTREEVLLLQKVLPKAEEGEELSRAILHIRLNPIPVTKLRQFLLRVLIAEKILPSPQTTSLSSRSSSSLSFSSAVVNKLLASLPSSIDLPSILHLCNGDVRHALMSLQFASVGWRDCRERYRMNDFMKKEERRSFSSASFSRTMPRNSQGRKKTDDEAKEEKKKKSVEQHDDAEIGSEKRRRISTKRQEILSSSLRDERREKEDSEGDVEETTGDLGLGTTDRKEGHTAEKGKRSGEGEDERKEKMTERKDVVLKSHRKGLIDRFIKDEEGEQENKMKKKKSIDVALGKEAGEHRDQRSKSEGEIEEGEGGGGKDERWTLFHTLGKILYNKRLVYPEELRSAIEQNDKKKKNFSLSFKEGLSGEEGDNFMEKFFSRYQSNPNWLCCLPSYDSRDSSMMKGMRGVSSSKIQKEEEVDDARNLSSSFSSSLEGCSSSREGSTIEKREDGDIPLPSGLSPVPINNIGCICTYTSPAISSSMLTGFSSSDGNGAEVICKRRKSFMMDGRRNLEEEIRGNVRPSLSAWMDRGSRKGEEKDVFITDSIGQRSHHPNGLRLSPQKEREGTSNLRNGRGEEEAKDIFPLLSLSKDNSNPYRYDVKIVQGDCQVLDSQKVQESEMSLLRDHRLSTVEEDRLLTGEKKMERGGDLDKKKDMMCNRANTLDTSPPALIFSPSLSDSSRSYSKEEKDRYEGNTPLGEKTGTSPLSTMEGLKNVNEEEELLGEDLQEILDVIDSLDGATIPTSLTANTASPLPIFPHHHTSSFSSPPSLSSSSLSPSPHAAPSRTTPHGERSTHMANRLRPSSSSQIKSSLPSLESSNAQTSTDTSMNGREERSDVKGCSYPPGRAFLSSPVKTDHRESHEAIASFSSEEASLGHSRHLADIHRRGFPRIKGEAIEDKSEEMKKDSCEGDGENNISRDTIDLSEFDDLHDFFLQEETKETSLHKESISCCSEVIGEERSGRLALQKERRTHEKEEEVVEEDLDVLFDSFHDSTDRRCEERREIERKGDTYILQTGDAIGKPVDVYHAETTRRREMKCIGKDTYAQGRENQERNPYMRSRDDISPAPRRQDPPSHVTSGVYTPQGVDRQHDAPFPVKAEQERNDKDSCICKDEDKSRHISDREEYISSVHTKTRVECRRRTSPGNQSERRSDPGPRSSRSSDGCWRCREALRHMQENLKAEETWWIGEKPQGKEGQHTQQQEEDALHGYPFFDGLVSTFLWGLRPVPEHWLTIECHSASPSIDNIDFSPSSSFSPVPSSSSFLPGCHSRGVSASPESGNSSLFSPYVSSSSQTSSSSMFHNPSGSRHSSSSSLSSSCSPSLSRTTQVSSSPPSFHPSPCSSSLVSSSTSRTSPVVSTPIVSAVPWYLLIKKSTRPKLYFSPEELLRQTPCDLDYLFLLLHENFLFFFSSLHDATAVTTHLADCDSSFFSSSSSTDFYRSSSKLEGISHNALLSNDDLLLSHQYGLLGAWYSTLLAIRSILDSNTHPCNPSSQSSSWLLSSSSKQGKRGGMFAFKKSRVKVLQKDIRSRDETWRCYCLGVQEMIQTRVRAVLQSSLAQTRPPMIGRRAHSITSSNSSSSSSCSSSFLTGGQNSPRDENDVKQVRDSGRREDSSSKRDRGACSDPMLEKISPRKEDECGPFLDGQGMNRRERDVSRKQDEEEEKRDKGVISNRSCLSYSCVPSHDVRRERISSLGESWKGGVKTQVSADMKDFDRVHKFIEEQLYRAHTGVISLSIRRFFMEVLPYVTRMNRDNRQAVTLASPSSFMKSSGQLSSLHPDALQRLLSRKEGRRGSLFSSGCLAFLQKVEEPILQRLRGATTVGGTRGSIITTGGGSISASTMMTVGSLRAESMSRNDLWNQDTKSSSGVLEEEVEEEDDEEEEEDSHRTADITGRDRKSDGAMAVTEDSLDYGGVIPLPSFHEWDDFESWRSGLFSSSFHKTRGVYTPHSRSQDEANGRSQQVLLEGSSRMGSCERVDFLGCDDSKSSSQVALGTKGLQERNYCHTEKTSAEDREGETNSEKKLSTTPQEGGNQSVSYPWIPRGLGGREVSDEDDIEDV